MRALIVGNSAGGPPQLGRVMPHMRMLGAVLCRAALPGNGPLGRGWSRRGRGGAVKTAFPLLKDIYSSLNSFIPTTAPPSSPQLYSQ